VAARIWAEEIREECAKLRPTVLPTSALGKAVGYTLNMWPKLRRCFDYAEVELSNNLEEKLDATPGIAAGSSTRSKLPARRFIWARRVQGQCGPGSASTSMPWNRAPGRKSRRGLCG
jgi:hypothetical protein